MSSRRKRSDSASAAAAAMYSAASGLVEPPGYLSVSSAVRPFWDDIVATRAADSWTPNDLILAANLARTHHDIEKYSAIAEKNTRLIKESDSYKVSPVHRVLADLSAQAIALSRSLQVHARATQGESRDQQKRNALHSSARKTMNGADDLISRPVH